MTAANNKLVINKYKMRYSLEDNWDNLYEMILRGPLTMIYSVKKETLTNDIGEFSNLLIEKFAIHSLSFFHLSKGIVEHRKSGEKIKMMGYDLFTVNSTLRTMMECYATFNNIFIEPKCTDEVEFRFLLWKLDGLFDNERFDISENDFIKVKDFIERDKQELAETRRRFENCNFYSKLSPSEIGKVYNPNRSRINWRFLIDDNLKITILNITDVIKHTCKTKEFINNYRYTSTHTHTNYLSIEHFKQIRGKPISDEYVNSTTKLAIYLTCLLISDICVIDNNAKKEFQKLPKKLTDYITRISNAIKKYS